MKKTNIIKFDLIDALSLPLFAVTMIAESRTLQNRPNLRESGDMDLASEEEISGANPNPDPLVPVGYEANDTKASLKMLAGNITINTLFSLFLVKIYKYLFSHRILNFRSRKLSFLLAMIGWDFFYYWSHRLQHERRIFWANHVTHHSSEHYNLSTALRQPWSGFLVSWVHMPLPLLGIPVEQVMKAGQLNLLYQYWIHTETIGRLSKPIENIFNTPSHHRVHHGSNPQYIDKNYAGIFITWDKIFGTFEPEVRKIKYGLTKNIKTFKPLKIAYHELNDLLTDIRESNNWREKASHLFEHPK
ncbi:MAG TPA: sterol desaturase family protein [Acidimicrobiales bacterium]|jgi:sterol desaturase/sphingolipid hydroxylase (fatty acid hydroxylase superfamily)|nr:sterol desaturase family protein [Acidimicrobiales bacterium]HJM37528.1 sterol desaturase family protein [Acidimicrobiales bacterium]